MQQQQLKESIAETTDVGTYQIWFDLREVIVIVPRDLDRVERTGSRIELQVISNHACAMISTQNQVLLSLLMFSPPSPMRCMKPIAATIDGITKGIVSKERIMVWKGHSYLPNCHAIGIPIASVASDEKTACIIVNWNTPLEM